MLSPLAMDALKLAGFAAGLTVYAAVAYGLVLGVRAMIGSARETLADRTATKLERELAELEAAPLRAAEARAERVAARDARRAAVGAVPSRRAA
jgi:hypothetical protein